MKRLFSVFLLFGLVFILSACDVTTTSPKEGTDTTTTTTLSSTTSETEVENEESADLVYLKNKLLAAGYGLDKRDESSVEYYNANAVNAAYSIDVEVKFVYLGYVNQVERWAELIDFGSVEDAQTYATAVDATGAEGLMYVRYGQAVVITYSQDTIDALN